MLREIPPRELEVIHEAQRRKGGTAHAQVKTPPYQMRQLLGQFAEVLGVPIEWLLVPSTFKPTCSSPQPMGCSRASAAARATGRATSGCAGTTACGPRSAPTRRSSATPSGSAASSRSHRS